MPLHRCLGDDNVPTEVRQDLHDTLKAKQKNDFERRLDDSRGGEAFAVAGEEVLRLVKEANDGEIDPDVDNLILAELDLPPWASSTDVGAPLEALARFYRRIGKMNYALPFYL
ncbi:hypothetical protein BDZ89DRAFT_1164619 [Hymenopellis radicata]|nr:hypothetical protein BDZ89DRAFT_1164619 [Hymenopellis radicata]